MKNILLLITLVIASSFQTDYSIKIAKLKYDGGGDWYGNRTALPNLAKYCNENLKTSINPQDEVVEAASAEIFNYPYVYMTGHGNVLFNAKDAANMRKYLLAGGFLHIDDNYGLDKYIRPEMKKIFPELDFVELPFNHPIYNQRYNFPKGLPKIHEHDNKAPQGFAIIKNGRVLVFYSVECDLGDGWEDKLVHNDTKEAREKAFKMGANIVQFSLMNN